jgi:protein-S-isoprenylcysteine O-methyltransferase Ste14
MAVLTPAVSGVRADAVDDDLRRESRERLADLGARAMTSALFVVLAVRIGAEFLKTGHLTGLLLLVSEALVVALTVFRRPALVVDRALWTRIVAGISMVGIPFIRPVGEPLAPDLVTASFSAAGLLVIITGKLTLGRSFGLMPANRGVVCRGIYRTVRHPIYAGYLVTHLAFVAAHPAAWNVVLVLVSDTALLIRATFEERTLALDPEYAAYLTRVRWRVAPGLF